MGCMDGLRAFGIPEFLNNPRPDGIRHAFTTVPERGIYMVFSVGILTEFLSKYSSRFN